MSELKRPSLPTCVRLCIKSWRFWFDIRNANNGVMSSECEWKVKREIEVRGDSLFYAKNIKKSPGCHRSDSGNFRDPWSVPFFITLSIKSGDSRKQNKHLAIAKSYYFQSISRPHVPHVSYIPLLKTQKQSLEIGWQYEITVERCEIRRCWVDYYKDNQKIFFAFLHMNFQTLLVRNFII